MEILYQDDALVVVNKPAGLLSIQDGYQPKLPNVKKILESEFGRLYTVHRLDKETSGAIIFARNSQSHKSMNIRFENRMVNKTYLAYVFGDLSSTCFTIDLPLLINGDRRHRTTIDPGKGKPAITEIQLISHLESGTLLYAHPKTGYTHQIRAHLAAIGHPILGDLLYGTKLILRSQKSFQGRLQLHAYRIQFSHPVNGSSLDIFAPVPDDLPVILNTLNR